MHDDSEDTALRRELGLLDFTLLVTGAIIGDGIYVVAAMGAKSLGPAQLVAWLAAGVMAAFIALAFVQCAAVNPRVGGSYSYARTAFGPFVGFLAGWTLYIGEWTALSAFPQAFFNYFRALTGVSSSAGIAVKLALICGVTGVNLIGVRQGARTNDALTLAKLLPLLLFAILGIVFIAARFGDASGNVQPFAPEGWGGFGSAILPIFWAYAGFELAVLPAGEVKDARRTLPRGLLIGVTIATLFYALVSLTVVVALPSPVAAGSTHPLAAAAETMLSALGGPSDAGARVMSLGGLISIAGVYLVFALSLARLSYALAADGFFPRQFARLSTRYRTPYAGLLFQAGSAVVCSTLFDLRALLSTAVLFLSLCYVLTALSALRFVSTKPAEALHVPGLRVFLVLATASSFYLMAQATGEQMFVGVGVVGLGLVMYAAHGRHWHRRAPMIHTPARSDADTHPHGWLWRTSRRLFAG